MRERERKRELQQVSEEGGGRKIARESESERASAGICCQCHDTGQVHAVQFEGVVSIGCSSSVFRFSKYLFRV